MHTPEIKPTGTDSSMDTDHVVIPVGGLAHNCKPFRDHRKQLCSEWHLIGTCFDPSWKNHEAHCDSCLSVDLHGMAVHLFGRDCEGF